MLSGIIGHRTRPHDIYRLPSISHWIFNQLGRATEWRGEKQKKNIIIIKNIREKKKKKKKMRGRDEEMGDEEEEESSPAERERERERERKNMTVVCVSQSHSYNSAGSLLHLVR